MQPKATHKSHFSINSNVINSCTCLCNLRLLINLILVSYSNVPLFYFLFKHNFCVKPYVPREPRKDPSNRRLNEHGIYIRHCQESNSQPVPSQAGANTTRPQWRTSFQITITIHYHNKYSNWLSDMRVWNPGFPKLEGKISDSFQKGKTSVNRSRWKKRSFFVVNL